MGSLHKTMQLMLEFLGPAFFLLLMNDLPDDVICNTTIYANDTTVYSRCDQPSDLWQQLDLTSEFESDLRDTVDWGRKWLVISVLEKHNWFYLIGLITSVLFM